MNRELLETQLAELPLFSYFYTDPKGIEFSDRIRWICENECPRYGKSWACPPAVGTVAQCAAKCRSFDHCLVIGSVAEEADVRDMEAALATRAGHEELTDQVAAMLEAQGVKPYVLSTESCAVCKECTCQSGAPCRRPDKMHPCVESHGINLIPVLETEGIPFIYGDTTVIWYSLLFFNE